jgi:hypothetical protein
VLYSTHAWLVPSPQPLQEILLHLDLVRARRAGLGPSIVTHERHIRTFRVFHDLVACRMCRWRRLVQVRFRAGLVRRALTVSLDTAVVIALALHVGRSTPPRSLRIVPDENFISQSGCLTQKYLPWLSWRCCQSVSQPVYCLMATTSKSDEFGRAANCVPTPEMTLVWDIYHLLERPPKMTMKWFKKGICACSYEVTLRRSGSLTGADGNFFSHERLGLPLREVGSLSVSLGLDTCSSSSWSLRSSSLSVREVCSSSESEDSGNGLLHSSVLALRTTGKRVVLMFRLLVHRALKSLRFRIRELRL